jgi:hypothetical protein
MFKGSFMVMAEAIAARPNAGTVTVGAWQRGADTWRETGDPAVPAGGAMTAHLTVIRPSFSLHQVQSLPPR